MLNIIHTYQRGKHNDQNDKHDKHDKHANPVQEKMTLLVHPSSFYEGAEIEMDINDGMFIEPMPSVTRKQGPEHINICDERVLSELFQG